MLRFSKQLQDKGHFSAEQTDVLAELKVEMAELKPELLKWIIGASGFQTLVILGAVLTSARMTAK